MRIALIECYLKPTPDYGILANLLRQRGHMVWLGTTDANNDLTWHDGEQLVARQPRQLRLPGGLARLRRLPFFKRVEDLWFVLQMRRFLRHNQVEVVQINPATLNWVGMLPLLMPMVFILDWRQISQREASGAGIDLKNWWAVRRRFFYSTVLYDCATFLHPAGAQKVLGEGWPRWAKVVPLGVDPSFLQLKHEDVQRPDESGKVTFLYIGTLSRVRRLERLLHAAQEMLAHTYAFRIDFIGPETAQGYYQTLAQELGVAEVVAFCPPVPYTDVPATILQHDVALAYVPEYPLDWQYHPTLKVIEYGALGVPIIASDFAPNREAVADGENGLLVANTPSALAQAMLRFVTDPAFLHQCQQRAQARRRGTPWVEIAECYEQTVYLPLCRKKRRTTLCTVERPMQQV
jgi:glycosyltransferase involved in cell wall biosynthesis